MPSHYRAAAALMAAEEETGDCPKLKPAVPGNTGNPPDGGLIAGPGINGGPNTFPCAGWIGNECEVASPLFVTRSHNSKGLSSKNQNTCQSECRVSTHHGSKLYN